MKSTLTLAGTLILLSISMALNGQINESRKERKKLKKERIDQRFSAGLIAGLNYSQLDGDDHTGYDKRGFTGGLKVITHFTPSVTLDVEFLYTQKGAKIENDINRFRLERRKNRIIGVDYIDVPVFLKFLPSPEETTFFFELGGIISRKIRTSIQEVTNEYTNYVFKKHENNFRTGEFSILAGGGYEIGDKVSIRLRFNYGITKLFYDPDPEVVFETRSGSDPIYDLRFLRNYSFSVMAAYNIF